MRPFCNSNVFTCIFVGINQLSKCTIAKDWQNKETDRGRGRKKMPTWNTSSFESIAVTWKCTQFNGTAINVNCKLANDTCTHRSACLTNDKIIALIFSSERSRRKMCFCAENAINSFSLREYIQNQRLHGIYLLARGRTRRLSCQTKHTSATKKIEEQHRWKTPIVQVNMRLSFSPSKFSDNFIRAYE